MITSQVIQDLVINNVITGTSDLAKHVITKHVPNPRNHTRQTHHQLTPDPVPHLVARDLTSKQEDLSQSTSTSAKALTHIPRSRSIERDSDPEYIISKHVTKLCDLHVTRQVRNPLSRSDRRVVLKSCRGFKPIVRVGFYRLPGRRAIRCQKSLEGREDPRGKSEHLSRLEDEGNRAKRLE